MRFSTLPLLILVAAAMPSQAVTINFGNDFSQRGAYVDSGGTPLTDDFLFEFGYFPGGNPVGIKETWRSQWINLDAATFNEDAAFFSSTWTDNTDAHQGQQAVIWISNNDFSATESSEWNILTSSDWIIPPDEGQLSTPLNFLATGDDSEPDSFAADRVIVGQIDNIIGDGMNSVPLPDTATLQTYFVPEPSGASLLLLACLGGLVTRRR